MKYNYFEEMKSDILEYIRENVDFSKWGENRRGLEEHLNDELWIEDSVTGNASGSYTFNCYQAEEYICHNLDLLAEAAEEFGEGGFDIITRGAEAADVTIRCYLLGQVLSSVLDDFEDSGAFDAQEEEDAEETRTA